jgi:hypothetical protein
VDGVCDTLIREPVQRVPTDLFGELQVGDMVFFDGTHRVWALERAALYPADSPEFGGVAGRYLFDDGVSMRVKDGSVALTPEDYAAGVQGAMSEEGEGRDCVGLVRRQVVQEWLGKRREYYN